MLTDVDFYDSLPRITDFSRLADADAFVPLLNDWHVCCTDIVDSTGLIATGQYKTVNMVGASVIAAMMNALPGQAFPYAFGGDGASFAVAPEHADIARETLAGLRSWISREFDISLRAAMLPVHWIRAEGLDVSVARYAVSNGADYAMFSGGGLAWAERQMKAGGFEVLASEAAAPPNLTGLSCRWDTIPARNGTILSLLIHPTQGTSDQAFATIAAEVLALAAQLDRNGHPLPEAGPKVAYPVPGFSLEARLLRGDSPRLTSYVALFLRTLFSFLILGQRRKLGTFDPKHYLAMLSTNADFRKFDDGLKMTLDCDDGIRDRIIEFLNISQKKGLVRFGMHEQGEALVTCIVPSALRDDHVHFVDGAAGGYTQAARNLAAKEA